MYTVLMAVDSNEDMASRLAEAIASLPCSATDVDVVILNVFKEFEVRDDSIVDSDEHYDPSDYPESVSTAVEILENADVPITTRREHGDPAELITAVAEEINADCIALGGRKRSPTGKVLFGSVTQSVMLSADRPVHVVMS
ncbi:universal stress protein [Natronobeatus ordinarius]|uniref:universal stress protein n=1 Tax=Natronobeatus ordinarius TaxID=2963433 RepID=UPI0020CED110|nr:universal stress protein [Natronobeatus ordinarius]